MRLFPEYVGERVVLMADNAGDTQCLLQDEDEQAETSVKHRDSYCADQSRKEDELNQLPSEQNNDEDEDNFEKLIEKVGAFGCFQIVVIFLLSAPIATTGPLAIFSQIFTTHSPEHWCHVPDLQHLNFTVNQIKNLSIPKKNKAGKEVFDPCHMYDVNFTQYLHDHPFVNISANVSWPTSDCKYGWDYDKSIFSSTVVTQWNLVCKKKLTVTIANTFYNSAMLIGGTLCGRISDRIGRKKFLFGSLAIQIVCGAASAFAPNIYLWTVLRMIVAIAMTLYWGLFMIGLEMVAPRYRGFVSLVLTLALSFSVFLTGAVSYFIRDWQIVTLVISCPYIVFFLFIRFYPESPRWLMTNNKMDDLQKLFERMAKFNGKKNVTIDVYKLKDDGDKKAMKTGSLMSLVKTPNLRKNFIILTYIGFVNHLLYFGLTFFLPALGENIFLAAILSGLAEMPGYVVGYFLMDNIGRRKTVVLTFFLAGIFSTLALNIQTLNKAGNLALALTSKSMVTANQIVLVPCTSELLPTPIRTAGVALIMNIGSIGVITVPLILFYGSQYLHIPFTVFGVLGIVSAFVGFFLPETLNKELTDTVTDADQIGIDQQN